MARGCVNRTPLPFHHQGRLASISDHRYRSCFDDFTVIKMNLTGVYQPRSLLCGISREEIEVERVIQRLKLAQGIGKKGRKVEKYTRLNSLISNLLNLHVKVHQNVQMG